MRYFVMFFAGTGVLFWGFWAIGCITITTPNGKIYRSPLLKKEE